ncbi:M48 family metallopeptidase [Terracidiphilus gabretensis]|uniref:M48 family metallopeptidase n=1 Tax=Terracidiphilus gabretensis TaxID=1577687 RepID=UPI0009E79321|nr:M48 family metallopeptidase [Terracidiphilus gabretensis]
MRHGATERIVLSLAVLLATTAYAQQAPQTQPPAQPQSPPSSTPSTTAPAPGTAPVAGDTQPSSQPASQSANQSTAQSPSQTQDKEGKDKDKQSPAPGTEPVKGDVAPAVNVDPEKVVEPGSQKINVKPGSIDDVSAVGNREIGGRGLGNWYSTDTEIKMGKSASMDIEKSTKFITDPVVTEYVNRIGQNIVKNSDCKVPFTIKVIDSDEINAMALPGGFFYVNSGLILNADEEAELAGVMAHETAHVCAHHTAREMTRAQYAQLGTIPLIFIGGWTGYGIYEAANIGIPMTFLHFFREFEAQADYLGVQYMYRAGYDPQAFIAFFEKVQALEKRKPGLVAKAFSDHPQTPDRILHSQEEIARILPPRDEYTVTTSEFEDVKARLARIENKRRLTDTKDKKPSLRRASTASGSDPNSSDGSSSGDDRPTLKRRDDQGQQSGQQGSGSGNSGGSGSGSQQPNQQN